MRVFFFSAIRFVSQANVQVLAIIVLFGVGCANSNDHLASKPLLSIFIHPDVNISPYLPGDSLGASLSEQLISPWAISVNMRLDAKKSRVVDSCDSALRAHREGLEPVQPSMFTAFQYAIAQCRGVSLAARLKPSARSFLSDFSLSEKGIHSLPITILFLASNTEKSKLEQQFSRIGDATKIRNIRTNGEYEVSYAVDGGGQQTLKLIGRGDLNADTTEDLLLQVTNSVDDGSYQATGLFALTRKSDGSEIEILKVED